MTEIETQVRLGAAAGILDMRLDLEGGELWLDAKTWSPEGGAAGMVPDVKTASGRAVATDGKQLGVYNKRARALTQEDHRHVPSSS